MFSGHWRDSISERTLHPREGVTSTRVCGYKKIICQSNIAPIFPWIDNILRVTNRDKSCKYNKG